MTHRIILSFLLLWSVNVLHSQDMVKPIAFEGYTPEWVHYPWIDSLTPYDQNHRIVGSPTLGTDYGVFVYNINLGHAYGYLVQKLDLTSGELLWSVYDHTQEQHARKYVIDYQVKNDEIILYLLEENENEVNYFSAWTRGHLARATYDYETGTLTDYLATDHDDPLNLEVKKDFLNFKNLMVTEDDQGYVLIKTDKIDINDSTNSHDFISLNINFAGHVIASDTLSFTIPRSNGKLIQNHIIDNKNFAAHINSSYNDTLNVKNPESFILRSTNDLSVWDTVHLENKYDIGYSTISLTNITENEAIISQLYPKNETILDVHRYLFDLDGNLLDKIFLEDLDDLNGYRNQRTAQSRDGKLFGFGSFNLLEEDSITHVLVWTSDDESKGLDTLLEFQTASPDMSLFSDDMEVTPDNDYLIYFRHRQLSFPQATPGPLGHAPNWYFWMKIPAEDLGFDEVSAIDAKETPPLILYPNPTAEKLHVDINMDNVSRMEIVDVQGSILYRPTAQNIDVHFLASGQYWLRVYYEHGFTAYSFIKI